jgi:Crinkler effector protein N-terminal domain
MEFHVRVTITQWQGSDDVVYSIITWSLSAHVKWPLAPSPELVTRGYIMSISNLKDKTLSFRKRLKGDKPTGPTQPPGTYELIASESSSTRAITALTSTKTAPPPPVPTFPSAPTITTTTMPGTPVPSQDSSRKLNCLIEGESIVFSVTSTVGHDWNVSELKEAIQSERALGTLNGVDPHTLELWKVSAIYESRCEAYSRTLTGQH